MKRFSANNFVRMPWKNGGGVTTELFRLPDSLDGFLLRLSRAEVKQDGPFSLFPGIDRKLLILEGEGCRLNFPDKQEILKPGRILEFPGEVPIGCELLSGPLIDFNVMIARNYGTASVSISSNNFKGADFIYHPRTETLYQYENEEVQVDYPGEEHVVIWIKPCLA